MAVKIEEFKGRLRLRWSFQGKRYSLYLGLDDTGLGRTVASGRASLIDADLISGNFDRTLAKYKPACTPCTDVSNSSSELTALELFNRFADHRMRDLDPRTKQKYHSLARKLSAFLKDENAAIDADRAEQFRSDFGKGLGARTQKEYFAMLSSCWDWGIEKDFASANPWGEVGKRVKVAPKQRARPFTLLEINAILEGFRASQDYSHYGDFVEFAFSTGCRTGEAIGLRWAHLSDDCGKVWIGESVSRGVRKSTKTNRSREFGLTPRLAAMLRSRRPEDYGPDDLVFPAPRGGAMDDHNFRNRAWVTVLEAAGVNYRSPYKTRHSFISHALAKKANPMAIAQMTGHDPEVLFAHYAADIQGGLQAPDLLG
jgi:integrase